MVAGLLPGCCLALTIEWLHNWRVHRQGYNGWVGLGGGGHAGVLAHTVGVFAGGGAWPAQTNNIMGGLGFGAVGGLNNGPAWQGIVNGLVALTAAARYTILIAQFAGGGTHAVGLFRTGDGVHFFDSNHGEAFFADSNDFADWFRAYKSQFGYVATLAGPRLWSLSYN